MSEKEIDVIKENATRYTNLRNGLIVPKHNAKVYQVISINQVLSI